MEPDQHSIELEKTDTPSPKDESSGDYFYPSSRASIRSRYFSNFFAMKKTAAQGMMDVALITANANQLRYLCEFSPKNSTFYILLTLILLSLLIQVIVGVLLIFKGRSDFRRRSTFRREKTKDVVFLNNCVMFGAFLITLFNVFITAFSANVSTSASASQVVQVLN